MPYEKKGQKYDPEGRWGISDKGRRAKTGAKQLDGGGMIDGREFWLKGWVNKDSGQLVSGYITWKDEERRERYQPNRRENERDDVVDFQSSKNRRSSSHEPSEPFDDEIPF